MRLANPEAFLLLLLLIPLVVAATKKSPRIVVPALKTWSLGAKKAGASRVWRWLPLVLRSLTVVFLSIGVARPQLVEPQGKGKVDALDMMLVIDTSGSMQARDFVWQGKRPSRLEVVKQVIGEFIAGRSGDRIGLVVFGSEAFTQSPLTLDHRILTYFLGNVRIGVAGESTAVGDAVLTAANRLSKAESKAPVIILLTDGASNAGRIDPLSAGEAAKKLGIKIYAIGVGSRESGADYDEKTLTALAEMTGAKYYAAESTQELRDIYHQIDQLERTKVDTPNLEYYSELYDRFLALALAMLSLDLLFGLSRLRRIP